MAIMLKKSKLKGEIKSFKKFSEILSSAKVETVDSTGRVEQREYDIWTVEKENGYTFRIVDANTGNSSYHCSPLKGECECDGRKQGYECRHIRLTLALIKQGNLI